MAKSKLEHSGPFIYCSSSISDWKEKILKKVNLPEWQRYKQLYVPVIFFGLYHKHDWFRYLVHQGAKTVIWCGSDIVALDGASFFWRWLIPIPKATHICENETEQDLLKELGIDAKIQYNFYGDPNNFQISFEPSENPHVYLTCHLNQYSMTTSKLSFIESFASRVYPEITFHVYGIKLPDYFNIKYHGQVSEEKFNEDIKKYHAALRLNEFDGFSEILAKSALMGQYPISFISYPEISCAKDSLKFYQHLSDLKRKKEPNYKGREFWLKELSKPII